MINPEAKLTNKAMSGHTSVESTRRLDPTATAPSVILGLDLFFWDANRELVGAEFEENTRRLFRVIQQMKIPLIIGKVPVNVDFPEGISAASRKPSTLRVNRLLEELCTPEKNCLLYDPRVCFDLMGRTGESRGQALLQ